MDLNINIFLSYITKEKKIAGKVKKSLEEFGFKCFLAHEDIHPTREWLKTILKQLEECDIFIPLLTKGFRSSEWTGQEIGHAIGRKKFIIPIKAGINPPGFLSRLQAMSYDPASEFPSMKNT